MDNIPSSSERTDFGNYHVFLSFRGPDTRKKFTAHLYDRLITVGFNVYKDDKEMNKGDVINENLKRAISNSKICIPIFSRTYASSKACLQELSYMIESNRKIIPIFFDVTPDDVKLKTPLYKIALGEHRQNPKIKLDEVDEWENALSLATEKAGFDIADKNEAEEITAITRELIVQLIPKCQDVTNHLVEIDNELCHVETLLDLDSDGFRIIGIFGMGGIGKTTLAKLIFNRHCSRFPSCCSFLADVRENLQSMRLSNLQRQLSKDIFSPSYTGSIKEGLENKKVLLILDDMDKTSQLTDLVGHHVRFASGSRIIITTRNKWILDDLKRDFDLHAYELKEMDDDRAGKLFSRNAFRRDFPPEEFQALSKKAISYIKGIPLALEIFGSSLCGKSKEEWEEMMKELKEFPDKRIQDRLMISYQGLKINQKEIFLDIACYDRELNKTHACCMWKDCGLYPKSAIQALQDCSLIKVKYSTHNGESLWMHDVLKDLGRAIVQEKSNKSGGIPSRLQIDKSLDILHEKKANKLKVLNLDGCGWDMPEMPFTKFSSLEILTLDGCKDLTNTATSITELKHLTQLSIRNTRLHGSIDWIGNLTSLCKLNLSYTYITELPDSIRCLTQLKELRVCGPCTSERVPELPSSLTHLYLDYTVSQMHVCWSSQFKLTNIIELELCCRLTRRWQYSCLSFEWIRSATNLKKLYLHIPYVITGLEMVNELSRLEYLHVHFAKFQYLQHLPSSLLHLELRNCEFPNGILDVSNLKDLQYLRVDERLVIFGSEDELRAEAVQRTKERKRGIGRVQHFVCRLRPNDMQDILETSRLFSREPQKYGREYSELCKLNRFDCFCFDKLRNIQGLAKLESLEDVYITHCNSLELSTADLSKLENAQNMTIDIYGCNKLPRVDRKGGSMYR